MRSAAPSGAARPAPARSGTPSAAFARRSWRNVKRSCCGGRRPSGWFGRNVAHGPSSFSAHRQVAPEEAVLARHLLAHPLPRSLRRHSRHRERHRNTSRRSAATAQSRKCRHFVKNPLFARFFGDSPAVCGSPAGKPGARAVDVAGAGLAEQRERDPEVLRERREQLAHAGLAAAASAHAYGRPISAASAPSASARQTSAPLRMPPSTSTGTAPASSATTSRSATAVGTPPSSWRPPWLETTTASAPRSTASRASSAVEHALDDDRQARRSRAPSRARPTSASRPVAESRAPGSAGARASRRPSDGEVDRHDDAAEAERREAAQQLLGRRRGRSST